MLNEGMVGPLEHSVGMWLICINRWTTSPAGIGGNRRAEERYKSKQINLSNITENISLNSWKPDKWSHVVDGRLLEDLPGQLGLLAWRPCGWTSRASPSGQTTKYYLDKAKFCKFKPGLLYSISMFEHWATLDFNKICTRANNIEGTVSLDLICIDTIFKGDSGRIMLGDL